MTIGIEQVVSASNNDVGIIEEMLPFCTTSCFETLTIYIMLLK